jgi:hypothetical protein
MSHTPSPWSISRNTTHTGTICTVHHCEGNDWVDIWSPKWSENEEMQEANARLIAHSPDLLMALKELVSIVNIHQRATNNNFAWAELEYAEEVIAKAT